MVSCRRPDGSAGGYTQSVNSVNENLIGVGLYRIPEAGRLLGIPPTCVRRWMFGYSYRNEDTQITQPNVAGSRLHIADYAALTFFDLLELRLIKALRDHDISLQAIRRAVQEAKRLLDVPHPFALKRIETYGERIFALAADETGDDHLLDLLSRQFVFNKIIAKSLIVGIDYDSRGVAQRWYPPAGRRRIVLDPDRSFGTPIVAKEGIPTWVLHEAVNAEGGDEARVARIYDVSRTAVRHAVEFERTLH